MNKVFSFLFPFLKKQPNKDAFENKEAKADALLRSLTSEGPDALDDAIGKCVRNNILNHLNNLII